MPKVITALRFPDTPVAPHGSALVLFVYEDGGVEIDLGAGEAIRLETSVVRRRKAKR